MRKKKLKFFTSTLWIPSIILLVNACYDVPHFPDTPSINFEKVEFHDVSTGFDSLLITIQFTDGNGDLGLSTNETDEVLFRDGDYLFESEDNVLSSDEVVTPRDIGRDLSNFVGYPLSDNIDGLGFTKIPPYALPYSCTHWQIRPKIEGEEIQDTVFFIPNKDHFNIFVDFLYKEVAQGEFQQFDWVGSEELRDCGLPINGRFPILQESGDGAAIDGTLKYGFVSTGLLPLFGDKILKLRVQIQDRALNESNIIESQEFTLRGIQIN